MAPTLGTTAIRLCKFGSEIINTLNTFCMRMPTCVIASIYLYCFQMSPLQKYLSQLAEQSLSDAFYEPMTAQ